ncbi:MAG: hypothetical protein NNA18_11095 [Nitrospira sp.]|nr:hypothetical protein [Nitrospira sp.]
MKTGITYGLATGRIAIFLYFFGLCLAPIPCLGHGGQNPGHALQTRTTDVVRVKTGSGSDQIGVATPSEANPEGPMSFALGKDGEIYILDQLNSRIQVFEDGRWVRSIPIHADKAMHFKDVDLAPDGRIVLLANSYVKGREKNSLLLIDSHGKILHVYPLGDLEWVGEVQIVSEGKLAGIWVELEGCSVRIASLDGKATERVFVPGKVLLNGQGFINGKRRGRVTATVSRSQNGFSHWEREHTMHFDIAIDHLLGVWEDRNGRVYVGAFLEGEQTAGRKKYSSEMIVFSSELEELGRFKLFVQNASHEIHRSVRVSPEGHVYQLSLNDQWVFIRKYEIVP